MPTNYKNGKVYQIWSVHTEQVYVGSTTQKLSQRMTKHRLDYKSYLEGKRGYVSSFEILDLGDVKIELIENFPCNSKEELRAREGFYIRKENCVNKRIAGRTKKEYLKEHPEKVRESAKKYREENPDKVREQDRKYREKNPEKVKERNRKYREENPEKERERCRIKSAKRVRCSCGSSVTYGSLSKHRKTQKHKQTVLISHNIFNHL